MSKTAPFLRGTRGVVLLSSRVWKDANGWALEIGISCTYSNPVVTGGQKHTHTLIMPSYITWLPSHKMLSFIEAEESAHGIILGIKYATIGSRGHKGGRQTSFPWEDFSSTLASTNKKLLLSLGSWHEPHIFNSKCPYLLVIHVLL